MPPSEAFWTSLAKVDPEVGCKVYYRNEVELVVLDEGESAFLRVIPNRKRAMPILVELPEEMRHQLLLVADAALKCNLQEDAERRLSWFKSQNKTLQEARAQSELKWIQASERQNVAIQEKDEVITSQLNTLRQMEAELQQLRQKNQHLLAFGRDAIRKLHNLRVAVLSALDPEKQPDLWKRLHCELRLALVVEGYRMRVAMSLFDPRRWFGGGDSLPASFFLPDNDLDVRDAAIRQDATRGVLDTLLNQLYPTLEDSLVFEEMQRAAAKDQK